MSATVQIQRWTGTAGAETKTDVSGTNLRHRTDDVVGSSGTAGALPIPAPPNYTYSYWIHLALHVTGGAFATVTNAKCFTDGVSSHPAGVQTMAQVSTTYVQATGTPGVTGNEMTMGAHAGLVSAPVDIFTFVTGAPASLGGSVVAPGRVGNFFVSQMKIASSAVGGAVPAETLTFQWDET